MKHDKAVKAVEILEEIRQAETFRNYIQSTTITSIGEGRDYTPVPPAIVDVLNQVIMGVAESHVEDMNVKLEKL